MPATSSGASPASLPPAILAQRYRLERRLAQGGMAEVWIATDLSLTRQVAIKLLKPALAADPIVAERFRREAIAVAQLSHPNIVAVYDAVEDQIGGETRQAVVMQLVNGKSLRQLLDEQKRLSPDLTMHIGACVAAALDCAHHASLVHRDVKPGNIMITPDGRVLLTDFGIAKGLGSSSDDDLTSPNVMMGTAKYLSPEQVRGRKLDGRADLYSLGLVLYECLAGRVPFLGETDADTALARLNRDPTDLTRLRPTLPYGLAPLIHRLLARRPDERPETGAAVRTELQRIAGQPRHDLTGDTSRDLARGNTPARGATPPRGTGVRNTGPTARIGSAPGGRAGFTTGSTATVPGATGPGARRSSPVTGTRTPAPVGGYQPVRTGRPAGAPVRPDRTPPSTVRPRQQPNRKFEQRATPSMVVVGGLLLAAFIVGLVLWVMMGSDDSGGLPGATTVAPTETQSPTSVVPAGAASQLAVRSFDPLGDNGTENDDQLSRAIDGSSVTAWTTECYSNQFMGAKGAKGGVGIVVDLASTRTGTLVVSVGSAPYQLKVYAAPEGEQPATFAGWGSALEAANGQQPGEVRLTLASPTRYVLVSFNELGPGEDCSDKNPYSGAINEITVF
ncbi:MAG: protein kinase [Actinomycetota bacterium]|nr:protein kinase [Actinomycetota bacterium]